jgi:hypothetical protein
MVALSNYGAFSVYAPAATADCRGLYVTVIAGAGSSPTIDVQRR